MNMTNTLTPSVYVTQEFYPLPNAVKFFPANFAGEITLPAGAELERRGNLLGLTWNHKTYVLGVTKEGVVAGFLGKLQPHKRAAISLVLITPENAVIFDARFTNNTQIAGIIADAREDLPEPPEPQKQAQTAPQAPQPRQRAARAPHASPYYVFAPAIAASGNAPSAAYGFGIYS